MAWEWSHTTEAYEYARERVYKLTRAELLTILREWAYEDRQQQDKAPSFRLPKGVRGLPTDLLADQVWARAEDLRTCDNGGWNAWICPDGCHTVPFGEND